MQKLKAYVQAARLRTLPLALTGICVGNACAHIHIAGVFSWGIFVLTLLTALLLQVLSNFANDYGDFVKGTDNDNRVGPERALQSGAIGRREMQLAMLVCGLLCLACGIGLLLLAFRNFSLNDFLFFLGLGLLSILAAVTYTVGKNAYGYHGLGDIMVFVFFGWVAVKGSYYLQTRIFDLAVLLPATSVGLFSMGVLNMNNTRDLENDAVMGKRTLPVRWGRGFARVYQLLAVSGGLFCSWVYLAFGVPSAYNWLYFISIVPFFVMLRRMYAVKEPRGYDLILKLTVLGTLVYGLVFCVIGFSI